MRVGRLARRMLSRRRADVGIANSGVTYWEQRASEFGVRSVLNLGHSRDSEIRIVTEMQKRELFPLLQESLSGWERTVLDLGCGPGRFTRDLAELIGGKAIGVDPIERLLELAPRDEKVDYRLMREGSIPVGDRCVDIVWVCLVLGGITDDIVLARTVAEVERVLAEDGLLFVVENTSAKPDGHTWKFRSVDAYRKMFSFARLNRRGDYFDLGERMSILAGRKAP